MKRILLIVIGLSVLLLADFSRDDSVEIVTDNITGLQWQDDSDAKTVTKTWIEAINYCEALTLGGYSDWRLPNFNELYFLADRNTSSPTIDSVFQNVALSSYWQSTTIEGYKTYAWMVFFTNGLATVSHKSFTQNVRCVRAGE